MRIGALVGGTVIAGGLVIASAGPAAAAPAPTDISHTQTFTSGTASFTVPTDATSLTATVAGGQGGTRLFGSAPGGAGGTIKVDLDTTYNGQILSILVGPQAFGAGGGGSYLATTAGFLAIAGGGGSNGFFGSGTASTLLPGGTGGFATASPDGTDGAQYLADHHSGTGARGMTAGAEGYPTSAAGSPTITSAPAGDTAGVLTASSATAGSARGGSGLANGGAAGTDQLIPGTPSVLVRGASGGGSGFVDRSLTVLSTDPNQAAAGSSTAAAPFITLDWTVPAPATANAAPAGSAPPSDPALAFTGAEIPWWLYAAAGIFVIAGALTRLLAPRRRRALHR